MLQIIKEHLNSNFPFLEGKKLLVACSGGVDSVVLAYAIRNLKYDISLAHCNFSLRGKESDGDADFVVNLADKFSVPVFTETFNTKTYASDKKLSIQMAARELRYAWFGELIDSLHFDYVLTGHHLDDDMETFFINLSRGTGLNGLTGIPMINDKVIRPMLIFERADIVAFAKKEELFWREDSSNSSTDYLRNKIRLEVLPAYKSIGKNLSTTFAATQKHLQGSSKLVDDYLMLIHNLTVSEIHEGYKIDIARLEQLPNLDALLFEMFSPFGFTDIKAIEGLLRAQSGKIVLSATHRLLKDRTSLLLTEIPSEENKEHFFISETDKKIITPIYLELNPIDKLGNINATTIYVDSDKIEYPLELRRWNEGDVFQPFGMTGNKKLSKFFKDEKLSLVAKEKIWLLCSANNIIWIIGVRADDRFKVTNQTTRIIKISTK